MGCCTSLCERFKDALCWNVTLPVSDRGCCALNFTRVVLTALTVFYSITILLPEISSLSATDNGLGFSF